MGLLEKAAKLVRGLFGIETETPQPPPRLDATSEEALGNSLQALVPGERGWITSATTPGFLPPVTLRKVLANGTRRPLRGWARLPRPTGARHTPSKTSNASISRS